MYCLSRLKTRSKCPRGRCSIPHPRASPHARRPRGNADDIGRNRPGKPATLTPPKLCAAFARGSQSCGDCREGANDIPGVPCQDELCNKGRVSTKHSKSEEPSPHGQTRRRSEPRPRCCCLIRITDESRVTFDLSVRRQMENNDGSKRTKWRPCVFEATTSCTFCRSDCCVWHDVTIHGEFRCLECIDADIRETRRSERDAAKQLDMANQRCEAAELQKAKDHKRTKNLKLEKKRLEGKLQRLKLAGQIAVQRYDTKVTLLQRERERDGSQT